MTTPEKWSSYDKFRQVNEANQLLLLLPTRMRLLLLDTSPLLSLDELISLYEDEPPACFTLLPGIFLGALLEDEEEEEEMPEDEESEDDYLFLVAACLVVGFLTGSCFLRRFRFYT